MARENPNWFNPSSGSSRADALDMDAGEIEDLYNSVHSEIQAASQRLGLDYWEIVEQLDSDEIAHPGRAVSVEHFDEFSWVDPGHPLLVEEFEYDTTEEDVMDEDEVSLDGGATAIQPVIQPVMSGNGPGREAHNSRMRMFQPVYRP